MDTKYLQHYAEPEVHCLQDFAAYVSEVYDHSLVIPAYKESNDFLQGYLDGALAEAANLLILVINQPCSDVDEHPQQQLADTALNSGQVLWKAENLSLIKPQSHQCSILLVNRFSQGRRIDDKQGVGLARKIGVDIALSLIQRNSIKSSWICCSDADATLPDNYFHALKHLPNKSAAALYSFKHRDKNNRLSTATQLYEKALHYYVDGLKFAGSKFAFHTIGSTLAVQADFYAKVRGFPKRSAGEDFYLLNKLAKLGPIENITAATIIIEPRLSDRVPFGTGPAVSKILELDAPNEDYLYYHPQLFDELKACLKAMQKLWAQREDFDAWSNQLTTPCKQALNQLRIEKLFQHIQDNIKSEAQCLAHTHNWFDAFRTLKFLHYLQQDHYPQMPLHQAMASASFYKDCSK